MSGRRPDAHVTSVGLSRTDVANRQAVLDAKHQLDRCRTDADFATWSRRWAEPFVNHALNRID